MDLMTAFSRSARQGVMIALRRRLPRWIHPLLPGGGLTLKQAVERQGVQMATRAVTNVARGGSSPSRAVSSHAQSAPVARSGGVSPALLLGCAAVFALVAVLGAAVTVVGAVAAVMLS
jgi:hypothetical protein